MKSQRIVLRLNAYQLARGLQTIRQLEPNYKLISLNDLVKTIYHDYLAKMSLNRHDDVPSDIIAEILDFTGKSSPSKNITIDDLMKLKQSKSEKPIDQPEASEEPEEPELVKEDEPIEETEKDLTDEILAEINALSVSTTRSKASDFNDPNETDSSISTVTNFKPPKNWMD